VEEDVGGVRMNRKKFYAVLVIAPLVFFLILGISYLLLRKKLADPTILVDVYINNEKIVSGSTWKLTFLKDLAIWKFRGKPLSTINVTVKLLWSVKALNSRGEYTIPASTKVRFWAVLWWEVEGEFAWYGWGSNPLFTTSYEYVGYGKGSTLFYFTATQSDIAYAYYWMMGHCPEIGKKYVAVLMPVYVNRNVYRIVFPLWVAREVSSYIKSSEMLSEIKRAVSREGEVIAIEKRGITKNVYEILEKIYEGLKDSVEKALGTAPAPALLKDGIVYTLWKYNNTGAGMQSDFAKMVFGERTTWSGHQALHLIVDKVGSNIRFNIWVFIAYSFQDANGVWSPWFIGAKKLLTIEVEVGEGTWYNVSCQATAEAGVVGDELEGAWTIEPPYGTRY